ncbi:extended synaptotagmin-2 isoform X4 [Glossina fuscipes]|uniref:Extended synaptotagmin-2 isoform X4 n=1 Tax=Glossina fuscipes TaxID=7396 RepID=A0A9C6DU68_9MUSC|nr:extended synaptotagmin-2 isoform X4 [Glossina fuscipes]XP_037892235.1 extended synaptotagmin-2 isoform X4 [Glossina fuscipes]XP_037892236.1 extended synaptotagmin-2 isoform X4 [Glossina fuscipes]XP_037892237.1 extended synaptotagmin-2 isoform X4 [Glossina fuscipes]
MSDPIETVKVPAAAPATLLQPVAAAESSSDEVTVVHQAPLAELEDIPPDPTDEEEDDNKKDSIDEKMVAASKEEMPPKKSSAEDSILSVIYTASKKVFIVGSIYLVGYMGWSIAWLIAPVILSVARDRWQKSTKHKRSIAKASALASEKEVILARIDELPAWVYFPDVERCEWLNKILKQLWPNANHYARSLVKQTIEPNVAESLAFYKLPGFRFDRIILGTIPPRIGGVKVYDYNVARNEIIMDLDLFYASDCDINFYLGAMKGGIKDFQIHGWIRVVMKPLIRTMPLVGGLQIFFLNNPNIDFNLVGIIDFMDMPGLSDLLRRIIVEQIGNIMVLPNKLPISLSDEVPAASLKMPEPEGILRIHVVEAKDLMKKDIGMLGKGKSDPYAIVNVGSQEFKTQIIDNNVNPKWDYWCEAIVNSAIGQEVCFNLWDCDQGLPGVQNDDPLGRATIEIVNVVKRGVVDTWLTLEEAKHGLLHVRLQWYKLTAEPADLQAALMETQLLRVTSMSTALLIVFIDSARHLKSARSNARPDPYLVCSVGKQKQQTAMIMRDDSPVWEQGFTFLVGNPDNDTLQIKIYDQKTGLEIGQYGYVIACLMNKENMEMVSQPFQLQKSGPDSKLIMSLALRILKKVDIVEDTDVTSEASTISQLARAASVKQSPSAQDKGSLRDIQSQSSRLSSESPLTEEEPIALKVSSDTMNLSTTPTRSPKLFNANLAGSGDSQLTHRFPDITSSAGENGLGRIQLSIHYMVQRQKLFITIHKIMNIPLRDPTNIPDPYVKLYLLPGRSKESKRKTVVVKDNCNPVYDATFEYLISMAELMQSELEVTVCTQKGFLLGGSPIIGMLKISLNETDIIENGLNSWFDLQPEQKHD